MNQTTANLLRLQKAESFLSYDWPLGLQPNLETQIKLLRRQIPPEMMARYIRLKKTCGDAFAEIVNGACQGCGSPVPEDLLKALSDSEELFSCPSCGRFLYFPERPLKAA